jgi:GDP-L-fucose synthase
MKPRLFIAGHRGMVGSALLRHALAEGHWEPLIVSRRELDLCDGNAVRAFLERERPEGVMIAAAKVGGIHANHAYPADFLRDNLLIATNLIHSSFAVGVRRLLFLGSSCIYPKFAPQPISESDLLTGSLEPTNEAYAIAKIAGLKMCAAYRRQHGVLFHSAMPTNLYGPGDNYHPDHSHVIPGMIRRFHEAKVAGRSEVVIWGSGTPRREFLHVDDLAAACFHLFQLAEPPDWVNVGWGEDLSILELAQAVARTVGYEGRIGNDPEKPDGTPRKLLNTELVRSTGWAPRIRLEAGLETAYADFLQQLAGGTLRAS